MNDNVSVPATPVPLPRSFFMNAVIIRYTNISNACANEHTGFD